MSPNANEPMFADIYIKTSMEIGALQPSYALMRDTIQTFLHEKIHLLRMQAQLIALAGIEITLVAALSTSDFHEVGIVSAPLMKGIFIALAVIVAIVFLRHVIQCSGNIVELEVKNLTTDLCSRGCQIKDLSPDDAT